jgi:RTX calcium-binding nonapeptide repeat (4 copies)
MFLSAARPNSSKLVSRGRSPRRAAAVRSQKKLVFESLENRLCLSAILVTTTSDDTIHDGVSLRDAVSQANRDASSGTSDTISFDPSLSGATITLAQGQLELSGHSAGGATITIDASSLANQAAVSGNKASREFLIDSGVQVTINGLDMENGHPADKGGGIENSGTLHLTDDTIENNLSSYLVQDTGIIGFGGGIYNTGTLTVDGCTISGNSTSGSGLGSSDGGGIENTGTMTLSNSTVSHNTAGKGAGGGINNKGSLNVNDSTFTGNAATLAYGSGGAIGNTGTLSVSDSTFSANSAGGFLQVGYGLGGAIYNSETMFAIDCTFSDNSTVNGQGGAIYNRENSLSLVNCTVSGNTAVDGGGIYQYNFGSAGIAFCTISENAATNGGGINDQGTVYLTDSILAGNTASSGGPDIDLSPSIGKASGLLGIAYDLIGDADGISGLTNGEGGTLIGTGAKPLNPELGPLQNNGGATTTMALLAGSPAIGAAGPFSKLPAELTPSATTITYPPDGSGSFVLNDNDFLIKIDSEEMLVTSEDNGQVTVSRGYNGTTAADHNASAFIYLVADQRGALRIGSPDMGAYQTAALNKVVFDGSTLDIAGTNGNDAIVIAPTSNGKNVQVTINGVVKSNTVPLASINQISVFGQTGDDTVTLTNFGKPLNLTAGGGTYKLAINGSASGSSFGLTSSALTVDGTAYELSGIQALTINGQAKNDTLTVSSYPTMPVTFNGGGGSNTLIGPGSFGAIPSTTLAITGHNAGQLSSSFEVHTFNPDNSGIQPAGEILHTLGPLNFANVENLTGGPTVNRWTFQPGAKIDGEIDGANGLGTITYLYTTPVTVNLQTGMATGMGGVKNISDFEGGTSSKNVLVGANQANVWTVDDTGEGSVNDVSFDHFQSLIGGTGYDAFQPTDDGGAVSYKIDGGAGTNSLDYSNDGLPATVNLQTGAATGTSGFAHIQSLIGNSDTTLVGPNKTVAWNITASNTGAVNGMAFSAVANLTGGTANDTFNFATGAEVSGTIDGGKGTNSLNYAADTTPITVDLSSMTATSGAAPFTIANIEGVIGGTSTGDTLIGPNQSNVWTITGNNAGKVGNVSFSGVENLTGGTLADRFVFSKGVGVSGHIEGGGGNNTLDYSAYTTPVIVDLGAGTATNIGGGVSEFNVVLGGSAADTLTGSAGRDLLFGGAGADTLNGGGDDDILFSGTTTFQSNAATIDALLTYWNRTDLDYVTRVTQLRAGTTGVVGMPKLNSSTVKSDTSADTLAGGDGNDWFFAKLGAPSADSVVDLSGGELEN